MRKKAKVPDNVNPQKKTKQASNPESFMNKSPSWAFYRIDCELWCIHDKFVTDIMHKLQGYEKMTWQEISSAPKSGMKDNGSKSHYIPVEALCPKAQKRLEELHIHEDHLFSLRLSGKERIFGILDTAVFRILWYDPDHEVCPIEKS